MPDTIPTALKAGDLPDVTTGPLPASRKVHVRGERHPGLPAVVITGFADPDGLSVDARVLTKPFRAEELARAVAAALDAPASREVARAP